MLTPKIALPVEQIGTFCCKWRITELSLFGSVLRDDFRPDSDVDVLVSFTAGTHELSNPFRRHAILTTRQVIYAA